MRLLDREASARYYVHIGYIQIGYSYLMTSTTSAVTLKSAVLHILLALADGDKHGYGIMQEVARFTDGAIHLGPGTLYRSIHQLLDAGLISEADERPDSELDDERRRYYQLTPQGAAAVRVELSRLDRLVALGVARGLMQREESP
jgi:DNA-binding PadR family transcriptional regulator